ncbi:PREDICTED: tripartite motif-containing protein 2-like [Branchiostoma belcheri]|uniref:Tripartite motif-containing protein 2-like n=1 Tax=Branchiostoma belcheri TaxID=7741 RepID=A0A6P4XV39_BRABE|nr:PREDICTED: tripartite motif-containing protein 2-like [Branchiostoma belcheri]
MSVAESPHNVSIQNMDTPVLTISGRKGSGEGELSDPVDVAVDKDGNIAVLENGNKRVQIFDAKTGQSLLCFPVEGEDHWGIDVDSDGQFIVTSQNLSGTGKQAISVYSREGELTKTLKPDFLGDPLGVAVLKDGRMVVADRTANSQFSCLLLQPDGSLIREIGKGQFLNFPWFIAVDDSRDLLFVTDFYDHKVHVYDLEGNLKVSFGKEGENEGELLNPSGITFDPAGNIIVVNYDNNRLQVFKADGTYLRTVAIVRGKEPTGIKLTPDGYIAVACFAGHCVELYRYK